MLRICLIGENLVGLTDEGIRSFGLTLMQYWVKNHTVQTIAIGHDAGDKLSDTLITIQSNRLFLNIQLKNTLIKFGPNLIFYISPSCANTAALLRARILKILVPRARVFLVALQPVDYSRLERYFLPFLSPDGIFVQSPKTMDSLRRLSCKVQFLPSGVDTIRFVPATQSRKKELRQRYSIEKEAFVVLHVGHINRNRNIQLFQSIALLEGIQVVLAGSTSTPQIDKLVRELIQSGVKVIREYLPHIEELYQLANAYLFPVVSEDAAIGVPLSVLEAMACNLPVITTRFGGLPMMFREGGGFAYFDRQDDLPELINKARELQSCSTRRIIEPYDWKNVANMLLEMATLGVNQL